MYVISKLHIHIGNFIRKVQVKSLQISENVKTLRGYGIYYNFCVFVSCSDRTVKIWRARGGLDGTLEVVDSVDEVASN